jgi:predicted AAA+ superfamily ATPase
VQVSNVRAAARPYRARVLDQVLQQRLQSSGAVLLEGPKACGKTFTGEQFTNSQVYLDTDQAALDAIRVVDPSLVLNGEAPQLVDEWQLEATRIWNYIRSEVNRRGVPGQFILTGSSVPEDDARRHTGAGRFARLTMRPMSLFESGESSGAMSLAALLAGERPTASTNLTVPNIADLIVRGGWPLNLDLPVNDAAQSNIDYLNNIAEIDISRVDGTRRNPALVRRLLHALARNVAMEQKVARLAAEVEGEDGTIARSTIYSFLGALRRLMVLEEQPPWSTHLRSRATLRQATRTHFIDPSLAAAAVAAGPQRLLTDLNYLGLLFESLVIRDCRIYAEPLDAVVHHYRDSDQLEVDVVIQARDGRWGAFEVKLGGDKAIEEAAAGLLKFADKVDTAKVGQPAVLGVIVATGYGYTRPDGIVITPIGALGP